MARFCFVCNEKMDVWRQNFTKLKLNHSKMLLSNLLKTILIDIRSNRNVDDCNNCICLKCYNVIDKYDWMRWMARKKEIQLKSVLSMTEKLLGNEMEFDNGVKCENDEHLAVIEDEASLTQQVIDGNTNPQNEESAVMVIIETVQAVKSEDEEKNTENVKVEVDDEEEGVNEPEVYAGVVNPTGMDPLDTNNKMPPEHFEEFEESSVMTDQDEEQSEVSEDNNKINVEAPEMGENGKLAMVLLEQLKQRMEIKRSKDEAFSGANYISEECIICNDSKKYCRYLYMNHLKKHIKIDAQTCHICNIHFTNRGKHKTHRNFHNRNPGFVCYICCLPLENKDLLIQHLKLHNSLPHTQCVICGKKFPAPNLSKIRIHMTTHFVANNMCDLCGKKFKTLRQMEVHRKRHLDDRPEKCHLCQKAFKSKDGLKVHVKTHTDTQRPFACSHCPMRFKLKYHMQQHERRHIEYTKTLKCHLCESSFEHKFHLNQHIKRKHHELPEK
ncbi:zinc finger protein 59-like [Contarinia nasturtii]|uniref:zinc finger protein 59-like n=1 Tax=Contarinia nasturtii TaxID=265458 RepID=UPI0012D4BC7A|nr:zinc finger protein 59-like [Contarinia nasturtii]